MKLIIIGIILFLISAQIFSQQTKIEPNRFLKVRNGKFGVTDSLNITVVPFLYQFIEYKNKRLIVRNNGLSGLFTTNNNVILPLVYKFILPRNNDRFILWTPNSKNGLCDINGNLILPIKFKSISSTENDDFFVTQNDKNLNGVYGINGENILPEIYKFYTQDGYKVFATKNNQPLILNLQNPDSIKVLDKGISFVETLRHYSMEEKFFQIIKKANKFGLINVNNELVIPIIYDEIKSSQHWRNYIIKQNGKLGIINIDSGIVQKPIYDSLELRKEYVLLKRKNQKDVIYYYK